MSFIKLITGHPELPTDDFNRTFIPGKEKLTAQIVANRLKQYLSIQGTDTGTFSPDTSAGTVERVLKYFREEREDLTARGFWPAYMLEEYLQAKKEGKGNETETLLGDAGDWGYTVPIKELTTRESYIELSKKIAESLTAYYFANQNELEEFFPYIVQMERKVGNKVPFEFKDRFKDEETIKYWMDLLCRYRNPKDGMEYKDMEIMFTDGKLRRKEIFPVANLEIFLSEKNKNTLFSIQYLDDVKMRILKENETSKWTTLGDLGPELINQKNHKVEEDKLGTIYMVYDKKGNIIRTETYFKHLLNEEQGWEIFNKCIAPHIAPYEDPEFKNSREIVRAKTFRSKESKPDWIQYTTAETFRLSQNTKELVANTLNLLKEKGINLPLSALLNMAWNINNPNAPSSAICVKAEESAGLQMVIVPRIADLITLYHNFNKNNSDPTLSERFNYIAQAFKYIQDDIIDAKGGHSLAAVLFSHIGDMTKLALARLQPFGDKMMRKAGAQTSSVAHKDSVLRNVIFHTANNSTTDTTFARISNSNKEKGFAETTYTITFESTEEEYFEAIRKLFTNKPEEIKAFIRGKSRAKLADFESTFINLCYMLSKLSLVPIGSDSQKNEQLQRIYSQYKIAKEEVEKMRNNL